MKVALVVQRFGENIIGGAESHCYQLALRLSQKLGWTVHVYTTTAFSYQTWSSFYPEGTETLNNILVFRFKTYITRWPKVFNVYNRFVSPLLQYWGRHPHKIPKILNPLLRLMETIWFILQGPWTPKLVKELALKKDEYDQIVFFTYLYYPTVFGLPKMGHRCALVPLAHPEPALYFPRVRNLLKIAPMLYTNSEVEKTLLIEKGFSTEKKIRIAGCGLDDIYFEKHQKFPMLAIPGLKQPYITYLGRISKGKGVSKLIQYFLDFISETKNEKLSLVLAGENDGTINISYHPQIKFIGYISQADKTFLIAHSACVVNPSPKESLSLLALEGIALLKPLLVNTKCDVLKYYADNLQSVFDFNNSTEFTHHLTRTLRLIKIPEFKSTLLDSKKWVEDRYSWDRILSIYQEGIHETKNHRNAYS
jgi:glycosyltransferase involved in cell wall biosynthesis